MRFKAQTTAVQAVKQVDLILHKEECLGLIGESGSGKSTLAKLIMRLEPVSSGQILLDGQPITGKRTNDLDIYRRIQLVLQDSSSSLHPGMTVSEILEEPICNYFPEERANVRGQCSALLKLVDLDDSYLSKHPHQLSGGQKQRVCIARALAVRPETIIFDESVASLDPSSQTSMLQMLKRVQKQAQLSYLFITHDLISARSFCDRVAVMYQGEIVETFTDWDDEHFKHPYTRLLFQSIFA